jgi:soluble cytochrome b562
MDTSKFLKQIRSIIREEIEYALDKKMNESKKKDDVKTLSHGMNLMKEIGVIKKQQSTNKVKSSKTGLSSIQDILNETRMTMEAAMDDDYPEMRFTSDSIYTGKNNNMVPEGYSESDVTPEVSKALTRDYSALMAKLNEKKGA